MGNLRITLKPDVYTAGKNAIKRETEAAWLVRRKR